MKTYISTGEIITLAAPYARSSGQGALVGSLFGVCQSTVASGAAVPIVTRGEFELDKATAQAWTAGALIYWDDTNKVCTTTASGNKRIGTATVAAGSSDTTGYVRLDGVAT